MDVQPPPPPNPTSIILMQKQMNTMMAAISNGMNVKVENTDDERLGGPQKCGRKFTDYWMSPDRGADQCKTNEECIKHMPDVDVKFKVYRISDFDQVAGTIFVTFVLCLDWCDPSLDIATNSKSPDFFEHFWPKPELLGLTPDGVADGPTGEDFVDIHPKYKVDKENKSGFGIHRAALTFKYNTKIYTRLDFRDYPFDQQAVEIQIKLLSVRLPGVKKGTRPKVCDPERWRAKDNGHQVLSDADFLPEFALVRLMGRPYSSAYGPFPEKLCAPHLSETSEIGLKYQKELTDYNTTEFQDQYTLQIIMVREPESILYNMLFALLVVDFMVFSAHGVPIGDLADRLSVNLTLLLTAMAFKFVLSDTLPPTPYLTTMEKYVLITFVVLFFQGICFWFLADWYNYRCGGDYPIDWFSGAIYLKSNGTEFGNKGCANFMYYDRVALIMEVFCFVVKNVWFATRIVGNSVGNVAKLNHFVDLSGLQEFTMPEQLTFVNEKNNSTFNKFNSSYKKSTSSVKPESSETKMK